MMNNEKYTPENPDWVRRPSMLTAAGMYLWAQIGMVALGLLMGAALAFFPALRQPMTYMAVSTLLVDGLLMGLPPLLHARRRPGMERAYRFNRLGLGRGAVLVLMAASGVTVANNVGILWIALLQRLGLTVYGSALASAQNASELVLQLIFVGALPGICEELMFRGAMLSAFERRGVRFGVMMSAALFALMHGAVSALPVHLGIGVLLGMLAVRTNSLYAPMVFHIAYNSLAVIMDYAAGGASVPGAAMEDVMALLGSQGLAMVAVQTLMSGLMMVVFWKILGALCPPVKTPQKDDQKMNWQTLLVLMVGLLTAALNYGLDLLHMARLI